LGRIRRVGILGGSFNPAHGGHLHISRRALRALALDEVWWLVSPQNPLKAKAGMAPLAARLAGARALAADGRIRICDLERVFGTTRTAETLTRLLRRYPKLRFVWLMGADNLVEIPTWAEWERIFRTVPIAVFDRPSYSQRALGSRAARRFGRNRLRSDEAKELALRRPPAWIFLRGHFHPASATEIRAERRRAQYDVTTTG